MHRPALIKAALGAGMLAIVMLVLTACGGGGSAQEAKADKVRHIPEDSQTYEGEPLPAGRYATDEFEPAMSFSLAEGWTRGGPELRDIWDLRDSRTTPFGSCLATPMRSTIRRGRRR
jgi:hypothetical protein